MHLVTLEIAGVAEDALVAVMTTLGSAEQAARLRRHIYTNNALIVHVHNTLSLHVIARIQPDVQQRNNIDVLQSANFLLEIVR